MKTYNAMNSLINDYSSIENVLGEFLSINITEDDFGQPFYTAIFTKETLSQWCNLKQMEDENKHSFLRKIHSPKNTFDVYQRIYMGRGLHCADLLIVFKKENLCFSYLIDYLNEDQGI